jgi:hypothetical protein
VFDDCSFRKQINVAIEKSKSVIMWILRSFQTREASPLITLYKVLVIPLHEYCTALWSPSSKGQIQSIESVQWLFLRKIRDDNHDDYWAFPERRCKSTPWKDDENVTELYIFGRSWKIWSQIPMARSTPQPTSALVASAPSRNRSTQGSGRKSLKLAYPCKEQGYSTQCRSK